jgi:hypothetical protein
LAFSSNLRPYNLDNWDGSGAAQHALDQSDYINGDYAKCVVQSISGRASRHFFGEMSLYN